MLKFLSVVALTCGTFVSPVAAASFTTAAEVKPILGMTKSSWISVREFDGQDLLYVTHLWAWRCGLEGIRIGINGAAPENWPLPECHLDQATPNAIMEEDGDPYKRYPLKSIERVTIDLFYDDQTVETLTVDRLGQPISP
ncbi:hypothetical protein [Pseudophaeobacter sp.]|uniref:hypothetical protein n=1 Tax=Pseudophaeobacter sp. TaxID=1971739 RepID=UPI0040598F8C